MGGGRLLRERTSGMPFGRLQRNGVRVEFGVNLNNREPLIAPGYSLADLLDLGEMVEKRGFDSVWVGDSLFSKPRFEPLSLLSALSQRTSTVRLGTACLVTSTRNPLYLALEWATLDHLSGGRAILGAGMGNPEPGVRREFEALGLDFRDRASIFEEGLAVLRTLWAEGSVSYSGRYYTFDNVSFFSGTEMAPLAPLQKPPPIWVVSNIRLTGDLRPDLAKRRLESACARVIRYGDGWMTCCRAEHPEEVQEQVAQLRKTADDLGEDFSRYVVSYQVTMNIGESEDQARAAFGQYISSYYPELSKSVDLSNWGPVGSPDTIIDWFRRFHAAGVDYFICRFGDLDQFSQVERFAADVLPVLRAS
jgi:alkanesulfonate monooxygenase SsuD/methylene tetrahydromethanopterin reductase-like flavin-dependent oxidoreductase (luciferase family)